VAVTWTIQLIQFAQYFDWQNTGKFDPDKKVTTKISSASSMPSYFQASRLLDLTGMAPVSYKQQILSYA
jgi:hypothetical protein